MPRDLDVRSRSQFIKDCDEFLRGKPTITQFLEQGLGLSAPLGHLRLEALDKEGRGRFRGTDGGEEVRSFEDAVGNVQFAIICALELLLDRVTEESKGTGFCNEAGEENRGGVRKGRGRIEDERFGQDGAHADQA